MAVVNSGDPVNTLRSALDAYTTVQQVMIDEAAKLKDPPPAAEPAQSPMSQGGGTGVVPVGY